MAERSLDLIQGTLDVLILRTLAGDPMHGYGISRWIRERTEGVLAVQDAALYQALRRLEGRGWVASEWGTSENNRRARFYRLTDEGRSRLRVESSAWRRYATAVTRVLEPIGGEGAA
jgi:PadR family transcriptional regulator, regulatory protein PadR